MSSTMHGQTLIKKASIIKDGYLEIKRLRQQYENRTYPWGGLCVTHAWTSGIYLNDGYRSYLWMSYILFHGRNRQCADVITQVNVCIYRFQNVFLRCPTPRLHCFLSSHWPSFKFLSFMAFFIPSIQFFFGLPRAVFCFFLLPFFEHGRTMSAGSVRSLL